MTEGERLADAASLRRLELVAVAWTVAAALAYGLARSWTGALVLTGASVASIVGFRGLQRIVSALGPAEPAGESPAPPVPEVAEPAPSAGEDAGTIGWRPGLGALVRLGLLGLIAGAGAFLLDPEHFPAIVLGFSTLPAALMTEGLLQALRALRGRDHDDVC